MADAGTGQPKIDEDEEEGAGQWDRVMGWEPKRSKDKTIPSCHIPTGNFGTLQFVACPGQCLLGIYPQRFNMALANAWRKDNKLLEGLVLLRSSNGDAGRGLRRASIVRLQIFILAKRLPRGDA